MRFKVTLDELKHDVIGQVGYIKPSSDSSYEQLVQVIESKNFPNEGVRLCLRCIDDRHSSTNEMLQLYAFIGVEHSSHSLWFLDPEDYRICKVTGLPMVKGYLDEDTGETYLNLKALEEEWGSTTVEQMIEDERVFYTEWEETTHYSDDASICGEKRKVWEELFYNFKASVEGATDFDYLKEIADNFCEITDEINSSDKEYVFIWYSMMDGSANIKQFSNSYLELRKFVDNE